MSPDSESGEANPLCWGPPGGLSAQVSPGNTNWPPVVHSQHSFNMSKARFQACSSHGLLCLNEGQFWVSWAQVCLEIILLCQSLFGNRTCTLILTENLIFLTKHWVSGRQMRVSKVTIEVSTVKGSLCSGLDEWGTGASL